MLLKGEGGEVGGLLSPLLMKNGYAQRRGHHVIAIFYLLSRYTGDSDLRHRQNDVYAAICTKHQARVSSEVAR